jgi:hypothetical protein
MQTLSQAKPVEFTANAPKPNKPLGCQRQPDDGSSVTHDQSRRQITTMFSVCDYVCQRARCRVDTAKTSDNSS